MYYGTSDSLTFKREMGYSLQKSYFLGLFLLAEFRTILSL